MFNFLKPSGFFTYQQV